MAKFLTTVGNSYFIEQIILNAERSLTIVTPYLKLSQTFIDRLRDADKAKIKMTLIYGKNELTEYQTASLNDLNNLEIYFCNNLHAKCYHNETLLIISSMNLYEFSEKNNREMGILVDKNSDNDIYKETLKEIESIKNASKQQKSFREEESTQAPRRAVISEIDPNYNELWNFHLPATHKLLTAKYSNLNIVLGDEITIENFPKTGIITRISGRIDLRFSDRYNYDLIREVNKEILKTYLPNIRFYWNRPSINIYLEANFHDELTLSGLEKKARRLVEIFTTVADKLEI